jgi:hypothetical protein
MIDCGLILNEGLHVYSNPLHSSTSASIALFRTINSQASAATWCPLSVDQRGVSELPHSVYASFAFTSENKILFDENKTPIILFRTMGEQHLGGRFNMHTTHTHTTACSSAALTSSICASSLGSLIMVADTMRVSKTHGTPSTKISDGSSTPPAPMLS